MNTLKRFWSEFLVLFVLLLLMLVSFNPKDGYYRSAVVRSDGQGYFAYLPAIVAHQDLTWEKSTQDEASLPEFNGRHYLHQNAEGVLFDKYYPGVAVLQLPFYTLGYALESLIAEGNSYGILPIFFFHLGSIFYGFLGFIFLKRFLLKSFENKRYVILSSLLIFFGTNVFYQIVFHPSFSHQYSFTMMSLFALLARVYVEKQTPKNALLLGLTLGMIFLIRPTNVLIVFALPLLMIQKENILQFFMGIFTLKNLHLLLATLGFTACILILFTLNYLQTGAIFNWSYQGEGFNFGSPEIINTLFSFRTGLFVHIPMTLFSLMGLYFAYKKGYTWMPLAWVFYFFILVYLTASWWCWDYGGSWGHRVFTEQMVFFAPPMVFLLQNVKRRKLVIGVLSLMAVMFCFRLYQVRHDLAPSRLTPELYVRTLFNVEHTEGVKKYYFPRSCKPFGTCIATTDLPIEGGRELTFTPERTYGGGALFVYPEDRSYDRFFIRCTADKTLAENADWNDVLLVFDGRDENEETINYVALPFYEYYKEGRNGQKHIEVSREMIDLLGEVKSIKIYIWNKGQSTFKLQNFKVVVEQYHVN
ncbi:hypothetical protein SAMN05216474_1377 [Lishizhenia tianjinensis]|uniref:Dolichyl-phosphate-mannose-protein mannosyltransferase n=1 Tax=Lishizhenia tianjinensis TaxID=477690 RepID=A0A1I6ZHY4_9FLAO|nr:hypothetical protein [Lishizhenia tianjinensis]SFT62316.1 hypothetical protein SAMN05216474_1377 [Lishizhenia tianjinensis]